MQEVQDAVRINWCHGVVVKHADSQHRGRQFDSSMRHNKNAIDEKGRGKLHYEIHFPG